MKLLKYNKAFVKIIDHKLKKKNLVHLHHWLLLEQLHLLKFYSLQWSLELSLSIELADNVYYSLVVGGVVVDVIFWFELVGIVVVVVPAVVRIVRGWTSKILLR